MPRAKTPGAAGNSISISFAHVVPDAATLADSIADVPVTYQDRRKGLTAASIGTELGTLGGGAAPGLLALTAAAAKLPAAMAPTALGGNLLRLKVPAESGSGTAFTLEAVGTDPLLAAVTAAVEDVDAGAETFTLMIALDHSEAGATSHDLDAKFGLLLDVPPGPDGFAAPVEGTATLTGAADQQSNAPKAAEAVILSI